MNKNDESYKCPRPNALATSFWKETEQQGQNDQKALTLANDMASHPIMLGIAAIINDCKFNTTMQHSIIKVKKKNQGFIFDALSV